MAEKKTETPEEAKMAAEALVEMKHEFAHDDHKVAIGDEWFEVTDGVASFPLRLLEAAELAGFRRVG